MSLQEQNGTAPTRDWRTWKPFPILIKEWLYGFADEPPFGSEVNPRNMATHRILGDRFTGKSALLEAILTRQLQNGSTIYDLFGANDNEMLAWLDSPMKDRVVLVYGDGIKLACNFETVSVKQLDPSHVESQKIYITSRVFHRKRADDFYFYTALYGLTRKFRERSSFNRVDVIGIREADEFISSTKVANTSRMKMDADEEFGKFHNQMYHYGYALVLDQHRDVEVVKKVRQLSTFMYFKNMGDIEIPRPWWPFRYIDPDRLLRRLTPEQFVIKSNRQCLGVGIFKLPPWHIERGTGILERMNIDVLNTLTGKSVIEEEMPGGGKGVELTEETRHRILALALQHTKQVDIAAQLGISESAVSNTLKRMRLEQN